MVLTDRHLLSSIMLVLKSQTEDSFFDVVGYDHRYRLVNKISLLGSSAILDKNLAMFSDAGLTNLGLYAALWSQFWRKLQFISIDHFRAIKN
jgi:hypothetical protein